MSVGSTTNGIDDYRILIIRWIISLNDLTVMIISKSALLCEFRIFVKNVHVNFILLQIVISFVHVGILIQKIEELGCRERDGFSHG